MKKITLLIGLCFPFVGKSQQPPANLNLNNAACGYYLNSAMTLSGSSNTFVMGSGDYLFKSGTSVHLPTGTHISISNPSVTGKFNASICNNQLDVAAITPANLSHVPKFSKVEYGINLSSISSLGGTALDTRILNFLNEPTGAYKPGTAGYTNAFNAGTIINPYDPQQISVDMVLFKPGTNANPIIRHGFYYKEVSRVYPAPPAPQVQTNWSINYQNVPLYEWRFRFAPDVQGTWTGYINVYIGNKLLIENEAISFTVVGPLTAMVGGFIQKGPNPKYLQYSGTGNTYIPVGATYGWTKEQYGNCITANCYNSNDHRMGPTAQKEFTNFINLLTNQPTGNGGNATRILMGAWGLQIEYDKLNNYDTRQIEMFELDSYINLLEQKNVKLILGQNNVDLDSGTWDPSYYCEQWPGNPYNSTNPTNAINHQFKGINGINTVDDLFNPASAGYATALQMYKNRWRYIEARWGYSTAIYAYELLTEVDNIPHFWANGTETNFANWANTIAQYLKESEGTKHLTTVSYTGDGLHLPSDVTPSQTWGKNYIDMVTGHCYMARDATDRISLQTVKNANAVYTTKPVIFDEMDVSPSEFDNITLCTDIGMHNTTWASMFSGSAGPGMQYGWKRYNIDEYSIETPSQPAQYYGVSTDFEDEYERNYPAFLAYFNSIDFKTTTYTSFASVQPAATPYYEVFNIVNNPKERAFGWVHNRSYNKFKDYTCRNNKAAYPNMSNYRNAPQNNWYKTNAPQITAANGGQFYNEDGYVTAFGTGFTAAGVPSNTISISNLLANTLYDVEWYWTWGPKGGQIELPLSVNNITSSAAGVLNILVPPTGTVSSTLYPGDWAFKIIKHSLHKVATDIEELQFDKFVVSPNPSSSMFVISTANGEHKAATVRVFDISGRLVLETAVQDINGYELNLQKNDNGIYILKVLMDNKETVLKLIKAEN